MYRSKYLLTLSLTVLLAGCASQGATDTSQTKAGLVVEALQSVDNSSSDVQVYEVGTGDIVTNFVGDGKLSFATSEVITYSSTFADVYFGSYHVNVGDYVKKGDLLATLYLGFDQIDYEEGVLYLERLEKIYNRKCSEYEEDIAAAEAKADTQTELLELEQLKYEYDSYKRELEKDIADEREWLDNCLGVQNNNKVEIYAPYDAYIESILNTYEWAYINADDPIFTISNVEGWCYKIEDSGYLLKIGTKVKLTDNGFSATGTIIYNGGLGSEESFTGDGYGVSSGAGYAWVRLDEEYALEELPYSVNVDASPVTIKNVVLVPEKCVNIENGLYFAYVYKGDGVREKVYFNCPYNKSGKCWAIDGINVGDKLVIN